MKNKDTNLDLIKQIHKLKLTNDKLVNSNAKIVSELALTKRKLISLENRVSSLESLIRK